ncbi:hypothetical protein GCK72_021174 [Caenorhabditis remanei]|uniref:DUF38 domain-containing protein n=1 Tax=Caenorhabditis remanei TaxID=31234 RepID=A0A6A5GJ06_CAERE|nr:hypothetical protein GCK72_021174 [Caenorhabditis remanei]KAF1754611.1 hypothetical protein GCK72_021174 [Caenorhabditis remanei]
MRLFGLNSLLPDLNHQIHVKKLFVHAESPESLQKNLLSILPCLKPKELGNIGVFVEDLDDREPEEALKTVRKIANLEQWKQAEELTTQDCFDDFPSEFLMHFKRFVILASGLREDFLINLRDFFSTSTNFESCTIDSYDLADCTEHLESFCEEVESGDPSIFLFHFKISDNSRKFFEFKIDYNEYVMVIEKKNF